MKKYRFIKEFKNISTTSLYNEEGRYIGDISGDKIKDGEINNLMQSLIIYKDFFKEYIEEYIEPKFKVGDYTIANRTQVFLKINSIFKDGRGEYRYQNGTNGHYEYELRLPTKEELKKYFR